VPRWSRRPDDLVRIDVFLDGKLAGGDDTLGLVADVEQHLVMIDLDDGALDQIAIIEVLDGGIDCLDEVLLGADVVDRYLLVTSVLFSAIN
jgi:hypothetical protein